MVKSVKSYETIEGEIQHCLQLRLSGALHQVCAVHHWRRWDSEADGGKAETWITTGSD